VRLRKTPAEGNLRFWFGVAVCFLGTAVAIGLGRWLYPLLLQTMQAEMGCTYGQMGILNTINLIGYTVAALGSGYTEARMGYKWSIGLALVTIAFASLGLAQARTYLLLSLLMGALGVGTGVTQTLSLSYVAGLGSPSRRGLNVGIVLVGPSFGIILSAFLVKYFLASAGWQFPWTVWGLITLVIAGLNLLVLSSGPRVRESGADGVQGNSIYRNKSVWLVTAVYFLAGFYSIFMVFYPAFLQTKIGYSTAQISHLWTLIGIESGLSMFFWGWLSDLVGRKIPLFLAMLLTAVALLFPVIIISHPSSVLVLLNVILYAFCYAAPMCLVPTIMADLTGRNAPTAIGISAAFFGISQSIAPGVTGYLIDLSGSFTPGFSLGATVMLAGTILWWWKGMDQPVIKDNIFSDFGMDG
jgi:MFS family permease